MAKDLRKSSVLPAIRVLRDTMHRVIEKHHQPVRSNSWPHPKEEIFCEWLKGYLTEVDIELKAIETNASGMAYLSRERTALRRFRAWHDRMFTYTKPGSNDSDWHQLKCTLDDCCGYSCSYYYANDDLSLKVLPEDFVIEFIGGKRKITTLFDKV